MNIENNEKQNINENLSNENLSNQINKDKSNIINDKFLSAKDILQKLFQISFNSLTKLELSSKNQGDSLKLASNNINGFLTNISTLINQIEQTKLIEKEKKIKEREKKMKAFKQSRKLGTETNLLNFKKKIIRNFKELANNTTSNFNKKNNSKKKEEKTKQLKNFGKNTLQNFRKNKNMQPGTPTKKNKEKEKEKEKINRNSFIYEKDKTFTNKITGYKTKNITSKGLKTEKKRGLSKSFTLNPLSSTNEKSYFNIKKNTNKKGIKAMLYKKIKYKLDTELYKIEEKNEKSIKKDISTKNFFTLNKKKENKKINNKNNKEIVRPEDKIKQQEKEINKQNMQISKLTEELKVYKKKIKLIEKDDRKGIIRINQNKEVIISKNVIKISDEIVIEIRAEPLNYYDSYYYLMDYESSKTKIKEIYIDDKEVDVNMCKISNDYNLNIQLEKSFNKQIRKIKVIQEVSNDFSNYSFYSLNIRDEGVLIKYIIKGDDDIIIDDVTNNHFKMDKGMNMVGFEGKITNEIMVNKGSVVFSKKINYQIYNYIPEFKSKEKDIINIKESNNEIKINILSRYKKVLITDYGQEIEDLYKIKISNFFTNYYSSGISYPLMLDTKYKIDLVELNGQKVEYKGDNNQIEIPNFGAYNNQYAEIHLKYRYFTNNDNQIYRQESIITSNVKNSYCKLFIEIPDNYVVLSSNDIFQRNKNNNNEYYYNDIAKEDKIVEIIKLSIKKGEWDIQKEITLKADKNFEKCEFKINKIFKGGNLKEESYEIIKDKAELIDDNNNNNFIFKYNNENINKVIIGFKIRVKNSTTDYIFDKDNILITKIPENDKQFFKNLSDNILKEDKSEFPVYKKLGKWVYNYMTYNLLLVGREMTAKEIYNKKIGVCEHFTILYNTLLVSQGINAVKISGYALDSIEGNNEDKNNMNKNENNKPSTLEDNKHSWTLALIDGTWVPLDATWKLFEKNVPISHIFQNYGNSYFYKKSISGNNVNDEITKVIIKYISS